MDEKQRKISIQFLQSFFDFASRTPVISARILYRRFQRTKSTKLRKMIIAKLFSELASLIELFGALCISLRNRKEKDYFESLTTYWPKEVSDFFQSVLDAGDEFNIAEYVDLPTVAEITRKAKNPALIKTFQEGTAILSSRIVEISKQLANVNYSIGHIHNKVKHGYLFTDNPQILIDYYSFGQKWDASHDQTCVYFPPRVKQDAESGQQKMTKPLGILRATDEFAQKLMHNMKELQKSAREIVAMLIQLDKFDLL